MTTTLIAIAYIDVDGKGALTPFRQGEVTFRASVGRAADFALVLDKEMCVLSAARIVGIKEDGRFTLSTKNLPKLVGWDFSEVITSTPWVRRRPTRNLELTFSNKGVLQSVAVLSAETLAKRLDEKAGGSAAISIETTNSDVA